MSVVLTLMSNVMTVTTVNGEHSLPITDEQCDDSDPAGFKSSNAEKSMPCMVLNMVLKT